MPKTADTVCFTRALVGATVLVWLAASIAGCSGGSTEAPTVTTTTTSQTTTPSSAASAVPTDKAPRLDPRGPNPFTPPARATAAPTAIPGNRENSG